MGHRGCFAFERKRNSFASEPGGKEGGWIRRRVFGDGVSGREGGSSCHVVGVGVGCCDYLAVKERMVGMGAWWRALKQVLDQLCLGNDEREAGS